jgi:hypothetical protein
VSPTEPRNIGPVRHCKGALKTLGLCLRRKPELPTKLGKFPGQWLLRLLIPGELFSEFTIDDGTPDLSRQMGPVR